MKKLDTELLNKLVGIKWVQDGRTHEGADCVGLMELYFKAKGVEVSAPRINDLTPEGQEAFIRGITEANMIVGLSDLEPEDVLVFKIEEELHVGLYLGYGRMLHAKKDGKSRISRLTVSWEKYFLFAIREKDGKMQIPPAGPPAVVAVALVIADYAAASFIAGGLIALSLTTIGCLIGTAMIGYSIGLAIQARQSSKSGGGSSSPRYQFGELQTTSSNQYPVPVLYGQARLAGNIVFQNPVMGGEQIDMLIVLCEGEIDSITDVRLNGEAIGNFPGCSYHAFTGTSTQNVEAVTGLDLDGVQYRNTAVLHVHLETSDKLKGGRPNITCVCRGKKVQTWNGTSWSPVRSFSDNPAACIRDYLLLKPQVGGCGYLPADIDDMSFGEVYDYCGQFISDGQAGTEARYAVSYVIDQKRAASDNLTEILVGFAGALIRSGSKLKLLAAKTQGVVASFDEDDITELRVVQKGLDQKINRFGIEYFDPTQDDARILAWGSEDKVDQDERGLVEQTLTIPSINRKTQASRLSNQYFYELKLCPLSIEFTTSLNAIGQEIGDVIAITHSLMGWTNKQFVIQRIEEDERDVYKITAQEYNPTIYNDRFGATIQSFDYGTPPNPLAPVSDVSNIEVSESLYYLHRDGTVGSDILVSFDPPTDDSRIFLSHYQIELKKGAEDYKVVGTTTDTFFTIFGVEDEETYKVKVRTVSINGIISDGAISSDLTVLGKLMPPSSVTGFDVVQEGNFLRFSWDAITDADLARYVIRKGSEWNMGQVIAERTDTTEFMYPVGEVGNVTFMIKAVDTSGNESPSPAMEQIVITPPPEMNFINDFDLWSQDLRYRLSNMDLVYTNDHDMGYVRPALCLKTNVSWEDREAEGLTWEAQEAAGGLALNGATKVSGFFEMIDAIDLLTVFEFKIVIDADFRNVAGGSLEVQVSYSSDGVSFTPFTTIDAFSTYTGRYIKFKFVLTTTDTAHHVYFYSCRLYINAPVTRLSWFRDVAIPVLGKTILFGTGFNYPPRVTVTIVNGIVGMPIVSNKTTTQCDIKVYDRNGAAIGTAEVDVDVKGY
jgi:hypothetical protein